MLFVKGISIEYESTTLSYNFELDEAIILLYPAPIVFARIAVYESKHNVLFVDNEFLAGQYLTHTWRHHK